MNLWNSCAVCGTFFYNNCCKFSFTNKNNCPNTNWTSVSTARKQSTHQNKAWCDLSSNFQQACVNICHPQPSATCILNIAPAMAAINSRDEPSWLVPAVSERLNGSRLLLLLHSLPQAAPPGQHLPLHLLKSHSLHSVLICDIHTVRFPLDCNRAAACPCTLFRVRCCPHSEGCARDSW